MDNLNQEFEKQNTYQNEGTVFQHKDSKIGPIIGSIIVIIIILVGGLFFLSTQIEKRKNEIQNEESQKTESIVNDIESVEQEVDAVNVDDVDQELDSIEKEFNSI